MRLTGLRQNKLIVETNTARAPVFGASTTGPSDGWLLMPPMYGTSTAMYAPRGAPTHRDLRLLVDLLTRYVEHGCPSDRRVRVTLYALCHALGHTATGGRNLSLIRESLDRLSSIRLRATVRSGILLDELEFGLLEARRLTLRGSREAGWVRVSEELAGFVRSGSYTLLNREVFDRLVASKTYGDTALRLWMYLESERGPEEPRGWTYTLVPPRGMATGRAVTLAEIAGYSDPRPRVRAKVLAALDQIQVVDSRYVVTEHPKGRSVIVVRTSDLKGLRRVVTAPTSDPSGSGPRTSGAGTSDPEVPDSCSIEALTSSTVLQRPAGDPSTRDLAATPTRQGGNSEFTEIMRNLNPKLVEWRSTKPHKKQR